MPAVREASVSDAPARCRRWLGTHPKELAWLDAGNRLQHIGEKGAESIDVVAWGRHGNHADAAAGKVLLVLDSAVYSHKDVELPRRELQQFPVTLSGPPHLGNSTHVVACQLPLQLPRQALIK